MRKVAVCYPGDMPTVFMAAFDTIVNIRHPGGCEVKWFRGVGWCQARRRIHACERAIAWGADLIAQFDVDQIYEPDVLERLVARIDEGYRIVAAMVPGRAYVKASGMKPFQRLAWRSTEGGKAVEPVDPDAGEFQPCEFPTSACSIIYAEDLKRLNKPWYFNKFRQEDYKHTQGEDGVMFYRMLSELNIQPWVDTTIKVGHCHVFKIDETFPDRFADWEQGGGEPEICNYE